jgi:hypothetical protein
MAKSREDRFSRAEEIVAALAPHLQAVTTPAPESAQVESSAA